LLSAILIALVFNGFAHGSEPTRTADYDYEPPAPGSYLLPVIKSAADGEVLDADGHALRLADLTRAQVTVMSFIYTRCGQTCPYATGVLNQLYRLSSHDRALADGLRLISLSFDPSADTPAKMRAYGEIAQNETRAAEWRFLTTHRRISWRLSSTPMAKACSESKIRTTRLGRFNTIFASF
jgi:cytochrome oxidase Cu insertion factor (SCO1/SenC/PrrC family)